MGVILAALLIPGVGGMWLVLAGRDLAPVRANLLALLASVASLLAVVAALVTDAAMDRPWIKAIGVNWSFASDRISAPLLVLTAGIVVLVVIHARRHLPTGGSAGLFLGSVLLIEAGALATFMARDALVFFVAFEVVLVPMWVLISRFGDAHDLAARRDAASRFVLYTALGSTTMLAGILALVHFAGTSDLRRIPAAGLTDAQQLLVAGLLIVGLGVKVPLFPVHTWLPPAHTIAPTGGSVLLAAVLLKMGTYGLIRLPMGLAPTGFARLAPFLAVAGVIGILWGGLICLVERDLKRLIAYSSIAHMGFVALALATGTTLGVQAALLTSVAHGVVSAMLFFLVGGLKERWGDLDLATERPALREVWPAFGFFVVLGLAASLALPGLATFWGEFFTLYAAWSTPSATKSLVLDGPVGVLVATGHPGLLRWCAVAAALGAALAAAYALRVARLVWVGELAERGPAGDLTGAERFVVGVLAAATVILGFVPAWVAPQLVSVWWGAS